MAEGQCPGAKNGNQQAGEFTSALAAHESKRFWHSMSVFGGGLLAGVPIYAFYYFVRDRLGIEWRRWLTHRLLEGYFNRRAYYELIGNDQIDNPDQRLSDDVSAFTSSPGSACGGVRWAGFRPGAAGGGERREVGLRGEVGACGGWGQR